MTVALIILAVWMWLLGFIVAALVYRGELRTWLRFVVALTWPLSVPSVLAVKWLVRSAR